METSVQIFFEGMNESQNVRDTIKAQIAKLKRPHHCLPRERNRPQRTSPQRRPLPGAHSPCPPEGREVNVNRNPTADERLSDLAFAINDAFDRARRQLQDKVREMQGRTKTHAAPGS